MLRVLWEGNHTKPTNSTLLVIRLLCRWPSSRATRRPPGALRVAQQAVQRLAWASQVLDKRCWVVAGGEEEVLLAGVPAQAVDGTAVGALDREAGAWRRGAGR